MPIGVYQRKQIFLCRICEENHPSNFYQWSKRICKKCRNLQTTAYHRANPVSRQRTYRKYSPKARGNYRRWAKQNQEQINQRNREKRKTNPRFRNLQLLATMSRRVFGIPVRHLTSEQVKILLAIRLVRLTAKGALSLEAAKTIMFGDPKNHLLLLLESFSIRYHGLTNDQQQKGPRIFSNAGFAS